MRSRGAHRGAGGPLWPHLGLERRVHSHWCVLEWPSASERRAHRRVPLGAGMLVGDRIAMGLDVSAGGVALRWPEALSVGTDLSVVVRLPGAGTVRAPATVVWSVGGRTAVRFLRLDPRSLAALMRFVAFGGLV